MPNHTDEEEELCFPIDNRRLGDGDGTGDGSGDSDSGDDEDDDGDGDDSDDSASQAPTGDSLIDDRIDFRPIEPSSNFITEDKAVQSATSALSRRKYMIYSSHVLANIDDSELFQSYHMNRNYRYPEDVYRLQNEFSQLYTIQKHNNDDMSRVMELLPPPLNRWGQFPSLPYNIRTQFPNYFNNTDPLMFVLGGYYFQKDKKVQPYFPENKALESGHITADPVNEPPGGAENFRDLQRSTKCPLVVNIEAVPDSKVIASETNIFQKSGFKEKITFSYRNSDFLQKSRLIAGGLIDYPRAPVPRFNRNGHAATLGRFLYGYSTHWNEGMFESQGESYSNDFAEVSIRHLPVLPNNENLITKTVVNGSYENYNFITDMPFFAKEVEKIDSMKNLTVSIKLESNFVTRQYRSYGNNTSETENRLPSIYTLHTLDKVDKLPEEEKELHMAVFESIPATEAQGHLKKMLFTSKDVSEFDSVNNEYKGKVPMYVEFDIGTNQASPLAEMLAKTGLDTLFVSWVSQRSFSRRNGKIFTEIIDSRSPGVDQENVFSALGHRDLHVSEKVIGYQRTDRVVTEAGAARGLGATGLGGTPGGAGAVIGTDISITDGFDGKTQSFDFEDWIGLFFAGDEERRAVESQIQTNLSEAAGELVSSFNALVNSATGYYRYMFKGATLPLSVKAIADSGEASQIYNYLERLPVSERDRYIDGSLHRQQPIGGVGLETVPNGLRPLRNAVGKAYKKYTSYKYAGLEDYSSSAADQSEADRVLSAARNDLAEKRRQVLEIFKQANVKNFPLKIQKEMSEFNQFRMLLQTIILRGKLETKYRGLFRKYSELVGDADFAYSETLMYRIDKHRVDGDRVGANPVQSFYLMDSDGVENINFIDSQVIFGQRYVYRIYAYDFVVGTKYEYGENFLDNDDNVIAPSDRPKMDGTSIKMEGFFTQLTNDDISHNDFNLLVNSRPCYKIVEVPYLEREIIILDRPPMFPEVKFYSLKDDKTKFKIVMQATSGERQMDPIVIEPQDVPLIADMRMVQGLSENQPIFYESDDLPTSYQVYRLESPPRSYSDFAGNLHYTMTEEKASAVDYYEYIQPNKKYYYTFRCMDKSINLSNPTIIFQVKSE